MQKKELNIKRIRFRNVILMLKYTYVRFVIFVVEKKRKIFDEFNAKDLKAEHYLLFVDKKISGITMVMFNDNEIFIGRFGLLANHRHRGYGSMFLGQILDSVKDKNAPSLITLFAKDQHKGFYKKNGFYEDGKKEIEGHYYSKMKIYY